jgi:hypothetical protein
MSKLKNELTWSFSRSRLFDECRRAYYYHYYASWGGWEKTADELSRLAYILKNVRNIDVWIGDIVHQVIKWILESKAGNTSSLFKTGREVSCDEAIAKAKNLFLKTWEQSRDKKWQTNVKHNLNLFEHYYNQQLTRKQLREKLERAAKSVRNFYRSGLLEKISGLPPENILSIDELDSFNFEGVRVFAIPDFALRNQDEYLLYDWKTGRKNDNDILQLSFYQLYAVNKWRIASEQIKVMPVYLALDEFSLLPIMAIGTEEVKEYMRGSIKQMKQVLLAGAKDKADINHCPKTGDLSRCRKCRFQEICR